MAKLFGKDNPAYRGGVTRLRTLIRNSRMYKNWRELCFQKDKYKCVHCGKLGTRKDLEAHHHINEFADILQDFLKKYEGKYELPRDEQRLLLLSQAYPPFWKMGIALTLCKDCHAKEHLRLKELAQAKKNGHN